MITLTKSGDTINFTFSNSDHYLYGNGTISVPTNSLSLTIDESDMVTFKKTNNDIFISATLGEFNKTKAELIEFYKDNMVGGGGMSSGDVESMISSAISGKADTSAVTESLNAKVDTSAFTSYSGSIESRLSNDEEVTAAALNDLNETISGKVDTSAVTTSVTSGSTDAEIPTAKAVYDAIPTGTSYSAGANIDITNDTISCTLPITKNTFNNGVTLGWNGNNSLDYFAVAEGYNSKARGSSSHAEGYNTTAKTQGSHSEGYNTIAGSTIDGYDQEYCHVEGYQTSALTYFSHAEGYQNKVQGQASHIEGAGNEIINPFGDYTLFTLVGSHAEGKNNKTYNEAEHASGKFNNSVSASTTFGDSGNTLFSVGNGTSTNARHNAFEIRQNGDIYCSDGTNDVKLQDTITATTANTTALGGLSLVKLTQSAYDNLLVKDSMTLYVITDS